VSAPPGPPSPHPPPAASYYVWSRQPEGRGTNKQRSPSGTSAAPASPAAARPSPSPPRLTLALRPRLETKSRVGSSLGSAKARRPRELHRLRGERQIRAQVGVVREPCAPAALHVVDLALEAGLLVGRVLAPAAERLVVIELGVRGVEVPVAGRLDAQAEVDVVESDGEGLLFEAAHLLEYRPADR